MKVKRLPSVTLIIIIILGCILLIFPVSATHNWDWSKPRPAKDRILKRQLGRTLLMAKPLSD